jgi:hypothetical protein
VSLTITARAFKSGSISRKRLVLLHNASLFARFSLKIGPPAPKNRRKSAGRHGRGRPNGDVAWRDAPSSPRFVSANHESGLGGNLALPMLHPGNPAHPRPSSKA